MEDVMEVIAKTKDGVIINATESEVNEILKSVTGDTPKELKIGQKIPAIDYASSITKLKTLNNVWEFTNLVSGVERFKSYFDELKDAIKSASSIEI